MERPEQAGPPLSSIPGLIEQIRRERDEWKSRAEAAERKLTDRAQCCTENEERLRGAREWSAKLSRDLVKAQTLGMSNAERLRVRDARVEPPPVEIELLAWNDGYWTPAWLRADQKTLVFCDPDFGAVPTEKAPYWLPMPPPPEDKR